MFSSIVALEGVFMMMPTNSDGHRKLTAMNHVNDGHRVDNDGHSTDGHNK